MYDEDSFEKMRSECINFSHDRNCRLINDWCTEAGVDSPVGYDNDLGSHVMTIYTNRPGFLIGKGGCLIDKFKKNLCNEFSAKKYEVKFVEIRDGFANIS